MENEENKINRIGFFKKTWNSIIKIEKYPDMAAEGLSSAITYLFKIVAILALVLCLGTIYQIHEVVKDGVTYLQNEFPDFSYNDGTLDVKTEDVITIDGENSLAGKVIIDTKTDRDEQINKYMNEITDYGDGVIVLKDKVIVKTSGISGNITYIYKDMLNQMNITSFTKQDVIAYANSTAIISLYLSVFITIYIYVFIMYFLTTISNVLLLSVFGFITTWLARIKMRYVAIFNMSVYALTLSVLLNVIYIAINIFVPFNITYFQVMYVAVAAIYLVAAILILKSEFIKKQAQMMKIAEAEEIIKKQEDEKEKDKEKKEENKETKKEKNKREDNKKGKDKKEEKNKEDGGEPEGSNA